MAFTRYCKLREFKPSSEEKQNKLFYFNCVAYRKNMNCQSEKSLNHMSDTDVNYFPPFILSLASKLCCYACIYSVTTRAIVVCLVC
jgi:hypothetical protein